ncbi:MAG: hypothetical protein WC758_01810 [Candidatus Woesearchaeota archaeon]|jgi:chromosome segregation ATPase
MDEPAKKPSTRNIIIISIAGILFITMLIIFIIRPAYLGYATYEELKKTNLSTEDYSNSIADINQKLLIAQTNTESCSNNQDKLMVELKLIMNNLSNCYSSLGKLEGSYNSLSKSCNDEKNKLTETLDTEKETLDTLEENYQLLAKNTADNLCCKMKIDDPRINSYIVENNKVKCTESADATINC